MTATGAPGPGAGTEFLLMRDRIPIVKIVCYLLLTVLVYVIETAAGLPRVRGFHIDLLPCLPAAAALFDGPVAGAAVGIVVGLLYDVGYAGAEGLLPVYYMLFGLAAGALSARFLGKMFPSMLLLTSCGMLVLGVLRCCLALTLAAGMSLLLAFQSMCGQILVTALLSPLIYLPVRAISRRFDWLS